MSVLEQVLSSSFAAIVASLVALWGVSLFRRDASIVDFFWGAGFALVGWLSAWLAGPPQQRVLILAGLTCAWGLRLSAFLLWRNWGRGEDRRYAAMRARHGNQFWRVSLFTVFLLQAAILWFVSLPLQVAAAKNSSAPLHWLDGIGFLLWGAGFWMESLSDWQLARFQSDPQNRGQVLDRGLWRYTRHPNYFGDFCVWWGLYAVAAAGGAAWTIGSPLLMSWLLMKVSGVALLESTIAERRPAYAGYIARTNAFFPGLPKQACPKAPARCAASGADAPKAGRR